MRSRVRFGTLATLVVVAATAAVGSVIGIAVNEATGQKHWPWPFSVIQDHPWRWTGALILATVVLAVLLWRITAAGADDDESDGNQATVTGGRVTQSRDGAQHFPNANIEVLHYYGRADEPAPEAAPGSGSDEVPGLPEHAAGKLRNRGEVLQQLRTKMANPQRVFVQLRGTAGIGKTAVVAELARTAPDEVRPFYLPAQVRSADMAAAVLRCLADAVPDPDSREVLLERVAAPEADFHSKADDVLAQLGARRVWLILDDAQNLLSPDGEDLQDEALKSLFAELVKSRQHRVSVLLVSDEPIPALRVEPVRIRNGLEGTAFAQFVDDLAESGAPGATELTAAEVWRATDGSPRVTELLVAARRPPGQPASQLLRAAAHASTFAETLAAGLEPSPRAVLRVLAALHRPVSPDVLAHLTGGTEPDTRAALAELTSRRLVRQHDGLFFLPPEEAGQHAATSGPELAATRRRAAEFFEEAGAGRPATRPADLSDSLNAVDLFIEAGQAKRALDLIARLDRDHLRKWGRSDILVPWLRGLAGSLEHVPDQVVNAALLAGALAAQGQLDAAIAMVTTAGGLNDNDSNKQRELLFDLAGYRFRNAQVVEAESVYRHLLAGTPAGHSAIPFARAGLALCQAEAADFRQALDTIDVAEAELADRRDRTSSGRGLTVRLLLQRAHLSLEAGDDDIALRTLRDARREARANDEQVLEARCDDLEARALLYRHNPDRAYDLARQAYGVAVRAGNPDLYSVAGATLAVAELQRGNPREALEAAGVATRYGLKLHVPETLALEGVASLRCGDTGEPTRQYFLAAAQLADRLRRGAPDSYLLHEARGLALAGLALLDGGTDENEAVRAYEPAVAAAGRKGSRHRRQITFGALVEGRPDGMLPKLRALVG